VSGDAARGRIFANVAGFGDVADQKQVHVRIERRDLRDRIRQLFPALPVAYPDLRDHEAIVGDSLLAAERAGVGLVRIEQRHVGAGVDDIDLLRRQLPAFNDDVLDLLTDRDDAVHTAGPVFAAIQDVERKRDAAIDDESSDGIAERRRQRDGV
jgi:hypothetical protein